MYVIYSVFSITQLVATVNSNAAAAAAAARVTDILNRRSLASNDRGQSVTNFRGLIEFKNVRGRGGGRGSCSGSTLPFTTARRVTQTPSQVHFAHPSQPSRPALAGLTFATRPGAYPCTCNCNQNRCVLCMCNRFVVYV